MSFDWLEFYYGRGIGRTDTTFVDFLATVLLISKVKGIDNGCCAYDGFVIKYTFIDDRRDTGGTIMERPRT